VVQAPAARPRQIAVVVPIDRIDRASLAAIAYALSISWDVTAVHVDTGGLGSAGVRERWRTCRDGVRLEVVDDLAGYVAARGETGPLIVVVPTVVPRARWLYPLINWSALRTARALARRDGTAVVTAPYRL
jgi:hypothetical protein